MPSDVPSGVPSNAISEFPTSVVERLGYYVYALRDPRDAQYFYVGKGTGNRVFQHVREALESPQSTDKLDRVRAVRAAGLEVDHYVIRHGLNQKEAFEVESALIDWIGIDDLTNAVGGHHAERRGRMTVPEIIATYRAEAVRIPVPSFLVIVNRLYDRNTSSERLYEISRGNWVLGSRKDKAKFCISVFRGLVRAAFRIQNWEPVEPGPEGGKRRWRFTGVPADELQDLIGGDVTQYLGSASQNPIRYVNC